MDSLLGLLRTTLAVAKGRKTLTALTGFASYLAYNRLTRLEIGETESKAVLITGCDSGLGYSLALHLAAGSPTAGLVVFAGLLEPDSERLSFMRAVAEESGGRLHMIRLDVRDAESVRSAVETVNNRLRDNNLELIGVINNAGVMVFGEFEWQTERLISDQVEVNLVGSMRFTRAVIPLMRRHKSRLINITSHCALTALPGLAVYSSTKAALDSWSDSLRVELDKFGIKVIKFIPGSFFSQSRILANQSKYAEEMKKAMSPEAANIYGNYFNRYTSYLERLPVASAPVKVKDDGLYGRFDHALFSPSPKPVYLNETWRYRLYRTVFAVAPVALRDALVNRFVSMPPWKE